MPSFAPSAPSGTQSYRSGLVMDLVTPRHAPACAHWSSRALEAGHLPGLSLAGEPREAEAVAAADAELWLVTRGLQGFALAAAGAR